MRQIALRFVDLVVALDAERDDAVVRHACVRLANAEP